MSDAATLKARLVEAEAAHHDLALGKRVVEVTRDGRRVRYAEGRAADLLSYIAGLRVELAEAERLESGLPAPRRRAMTVVFGR